MKKTPMRKAVKAFSYISSVLFVIGLLYFLRFLQKHGTKKEVFTKHYFYFSGKMPPLKVFMYNISLPLQSKIAETYSLPPLTGISVISVMHFV